MTKEDQKTRNKNVPPAKPRGRSFCCTMFIYTFVFVSGVLVATILPDLAGHHFKQPYGKEYGVMAEKMVKDLPKYMKQFSDMMMVIATELGNRVWDVKTDLERRFSEPTKTKEQGKAKSTGKSHKGHSHHHSSDEEDL